MDLFIPKKKMDLFEFCGTYVDFHRLHLFEGEKKTISQEMICNLDTQQSLLSLMVIAHKVRCI